MLYWIFIELILKWMNWLRILCFRLKKIFFWSLKYFCFLIYAFPFIYLQLQRKNYYFEIFIEFIRLIHLHIYFFWCLKCFCLLIYAFSSKSFSFTVKPPYCNITRDQKFMLLNWDVVTQRFIFYSKVKSGPNDCVVIQKLSLFRCVAIQRLHCIFNYKAKILFILNFLLSYLIHLHIYFFWIFLFTYLCISFQQLFIYLKLLRKKWIRF